MVQEILRLRDVSRATGLSKGGVYKLMASGDFPKPIPLTGQAVGWLSEEVRQWQERQIAKRDDPEAQGRAA